MTGRITRSHGHGGWPKLGGGVEESTKSLEERGGRSGNDLGWGCPFIGEWGSVGEVVTADNQRLNGLYAIDGRGGLKRGINPGVKAGGSRCWGGIPMLEAWRCGMAEGGGRGRQHDRG
jgi:hypothetical protein